MADTSDLDPGILHALKTGNVEQALQMAELNQHPPSTTAQRSQAEPPRRTTNQVQGVSDLDEDAFYETFRNDPLGRRT